MDDFGKAASGLKEIFDSGDPLLIPTIQANIHAFQISVRREAHIQEQTKEINDLKNGRRHLKDVYWKVTVESRFAAKRICALRTEWNGASDWKEENMPQ